MKPVSVGCRHGTARMLRGAPAAGTRRLRRQLSIDISCRHGAQQQTRWSPLLLSIDGTDRRTPDRYIDPARHITRQCQ